MNFIQKFFRWHRSRVEIHEELDRLTKENRLLKQKVASLQHEKGAAEQGIKERRREKDVLRSRLAAQKSTVDQANRVVDQLNAKITQLREDNERLQNAIKDRKTGRKS